MALFLCCAPAARPADQIVSQVEVDGSWLIVLNMASDYVGAHYGGAVKVSKTKIIISDRGDFFVVQFLIPERIQIEGDQVYEIDVTIVKAPAFRISNVTLVAFRRKE